MALSISACLMACGDVQQPVSETTAPGTEQRVKQQTHSNSEVGITTEAVEEIDQETGIPAGIIAQLGDTTEYLKGSAASVQENIQEDIPLPEINSKSSGKRSELRVDGSITDGDSALGIETAESAKAPEVSYRDGDKDANRSSDLSAYKDVSVEFVSYPSQTISPTKAMVLSNLSANTGIDMVFTIECGKKEVTSDKIAAGYAWYVNSKDLNLSASATPYSVTVVSTAYTTDGVLLNSIKQTVEITVEDGIGVEQESARHDTQVNGQRYTTTVTYVADTTKFSVILPAVIAVENGVVGTDIYANFRVTNAKDGMLATLTANGDDGKADILLSGSGTKIKARLSSAENGSPVLSYEFKNKESKLQRVGPVHCTISSGKKAENDYYGTMQFDLSVDGV